MTKYAVQVQNVKKSFYLPHQKNNSLKSAITQVFQKEKGGEVFNALNGVTFNVEKGDFFGILGRNGSGKSTLLKIISDIYRPSSGSVVHDGKIVSFIELGVGFKPELTGRENVFLNGALLGFSKDEVTAMYTDIVEFAELEKFMDQKLKNYSSGMKVRLAFSVAIRAKADILILDEVLAVGDAAFQKKCNDYFQTLKDDNKTVILVTHSMSAVRSYCNKAILIEDGKIVYEGKAEQAAQEYLRLFQTEQYEKELADKEAARAARNSDKKRWGSGEILFDSIETYTYDNSLKISVGVIAKKTLSDVVIGMDIYTMKGKILTTGVGLQVMRENTMSIAAGEKKNIEYIFENYFGGGQYTLTMSLKSLNGSSVYDYWRDSARFTNSKKVDDYFPSQYPVKIKIH